MINVDEHALMCDFAQYYSIYDYKLLRPMQAAIFAVGLPTESRIKRKMTGQKYSADTLLLASIADSLNLLVWFKTKDGQNNVNRPLSLLSVFTEEEKEEEEMVEEYDSIEEYEEARKRIMGG